MFGNDYVMDEIRRLTEAIGKKVFQVESDDFDVYEEENGGEIVNQINKDLGAGLQIEFNYGSGCDQSE